MGTGEIGLPALRWILDASGHEVVAVVTQPDKPFGRRQELLPSQTKLLAVERGISVFQPVKMRAPESVAHIQALQADLIVVMAYGQILPQSVLDAPRLACLNLHASLLPRWRGAAPIQAAIEAGDAVTGITVMYMAAGLDTGDILLKKETPILPDDTGGILHDRLGVLAAEALAEAVPLLESGNAPRIPQDGFQANYAAKLSRENGRIDWNQSPAEIDRRIRAMNPWPAAHTTLPQPDGSRVLKVFSCTPMGPTGPMSSIGSVVRADGDGILVAAADGTVLLREVQLEGKKRMPAGDFLRGHSLAPGVLLGGA